MRYYRRKQDGTILTRNCPVGAQRRRRWMFGVGFVVTVAGTLFGFLSGRKGATASTVDDAMEATVGQVPVHEIVMGGSGAGPAPVTPSVTK